MDKDNASALQHFRATADLGACRFEFRIGDGRGFSCAPFDGKVGAQAMNFFTVSGMAAQRVSPAASFRTAIFMRGGRSI